MANTEPQYINQFMVPAIYIYCLKCTELIIMWYYIKLFEILKNTGLSSDNLDERRKTW